jgi:tetratricopeptide (TPR) repeat protein
MRVVLIGLALLGMAIPASAGVYSTIEAVPDLPPERVRGWVVQLRAAAVEHKERPDQVSLRPQYLRQAAALEEVRTNGVFSTLDLVNLSACYIRLGRGAPPQKDYLREAIRLLNSAPERNHFLVQANLASAYFIRGEGGDLDLAIRCQQKALDAWPNVWAEWPNIPSYLKRGQLIWYRRCERMFLDLLEKRNEEARRGNRGPFDIDAIVPGLRLVGPNPRGEYEAGALSSKVNDQIPVDAYNMVLQLVVWYPQDLRLYWLLGEMLNARGEVIPASEILKELDTINPLFKDLHAHHRVLASAARILEQLKWPSASTQALLLACATSIPRGTLAPPGVGAIAYAVGSAAPLEWAHKLEQMQQGAPVMPPGPTGPQPTTTASAVPFNWKHVLVGFAFGFLVAALLGFQWQEWRRRRVNREIDEDEEPTSTPPVSPG